MLHSPFARGVITLMIGAAGGLVFFFLHLPLPWILGSLASSVLLSRTPSFQPRLPKSWRNFAMVAIGTMLGAGFTPDVLAQSGAWVISLMAMSLLSASFGLFAYVVFRRCGKMDRSTALFAAMPGGLAVVAMLAEDYKTEINRVVLCHSARLVVLLVSAPIVIQQVSGIDVAASGRSGFALSPLADPLGQGFLALAAACSWFFASRLKFPSAMLLLPLAVSAVLHATEIVSVPVPLLVTTFAQIIIGSSVAERFAGYSAQQIVRDGWLAAAVGLVLAAGSLAAAALMAPVAGIEIATLFLAFLPGGAPELGVVALSLTIDPAMVAAHHVLRVFLIVSILPVLAGWSVDRRKSRS